MDLNNLNVGDTYSYKEMCELLNENYYTGGDSKKSQIKEWNRYFSYYHPINPKTKKESKKFTITEIFDTPKQKQDNRKNNGHNPNSHGNNKGKTKYGDVVIPTIIYLLKQSPNNEIITYSTRLLEMIGAISPEYDKIVFNDNYINNRRYSFKQDLKKSFIDSPCNSAANSNYIEYDNEYIMYQYDDFGKWYNATEYEMNIFNEYRKEVLKEMD